MGGEPLGPVEGLAAVLSVGLAVDYVLHLALGGRSYSRRKTAAKAVLWAAGTTGAAAACMLGCEIKAIQVLSSAVLRTLGCALAYAFFLFLPMHARFITY